MNNKKICCINLVLVIMLLTSCETEEQIVEKESNSIDQITASVFIDPDYKYQVFYDLETNTEVLRNLTTDWDLAFECGDNGHHIKLNSSRGMNVWASGQVDFSAVQSYAGATWNWDNPNGILDSTAIGDWWIMNEDSVISRNEVYVLNLGKDSENNHLGFKKLQILGFANNEYQVKVSDLSGENQFISYLRKDDNYNFIFLSILNSKTVTVEPPKKDWDLLFTKYTHTFYNDQNTPIPYGVTGVLINSYSTSVHKDVDYGFEALNFEIAEELNYLTDQNTIGYDWKNYDHDAGVYSINYHQNYIIKNSKDFYFKMRFIDFFNDNGLKGNMKFEFQKLLP
ncbi:MAG: hypothetical protein CMP63_07965 [Flavobacteriales bacterium]|nr:hypothetical protein [Flavobacteriales bacterium]|tara:strand:- start:3346 stop:4362 length:1017 start_codon:yes stop_codon:yes gene_type:complete